MFIQGFGKAIREGPQAFPKCWVQAEWCLSALHRHSENWVHCAAVCAGDPLVPTAKSRCEWKRGPRISSLNAQGIGLGIWQPARLPAGMSPLLRVHLPCQVSDAQRQPHSGALAAPCSIANSLGRLSACAECPSAPSVLPCHHCTVRWNPCPDSSLAKQSLCQRSVLWHRAHWLVIPSVGTGPLADRQRPGEPWQCRSWWYYLSTGSHALVLHLLFSLFWPLCHLFSFQIKLLLYIFIIRKVTGK